MTVYVDAIFTAEPQGKQAKSHGVRWCHMISTDLEELHEMARKIGLKRSYFQSHIFSPIMIWCRLSGRWLLLRELRRSPRKKG
jgi:hypothetical protein